MNDDSEDTAAPINWDAVPDSLACSAPSDGWPIPAKILPRGDHADAADLLLEIVRKHYASVVSADGRLYGYANGVFHAIGDDTLARTVKRFGGRVLVEAEKEAKPLKVFTSLSRGAVQFVHAEVARPQFFDTAVRGAAFSDGFVVVEPNRLRCVAHSPDHRARHAYAFPYADARPSEAFLGYLDGLFREDPDRVEKIAVLQEVLGAAMTGMGPAYERALLLKGSGGNGKTQLIDTIVNVMPRGSVSGLAPSLWHDQYARPLLRGSLVNVVADLTTAELGSAVKGVITGELQTARSPGGAAFQFRPSALHLFGCNKLPDTNDKTDGFFRRWIVVPMNRSFRNDPTREIGIHERLIRENLPGIVRWGLDGAARLLGQSEYTLPPSHHLEIARWRGTVDAPKLFIESCTVRGGHTGAAALYAAFQKWALPYGVEVITSKAFGTAVADMGLKLPRSGGGARYAVTLRAEIAAAAVAVAVAA